MFVTLFHKGAHEKSGKFELKGEDGACKNILQKEWKLFPPTLSAVQTAGTPPTPPHPQPLKLEKYED